MKIGRLIGGLALAATTAVVAVALWQHGRYLSARRDAVQDRQPMVYGSETFHVVTFLKAPAGVDPIVAVRELKAATEPVGKGKWIYAGKVVFNSPSAQLGRVEWSAVTLVQYPSRAAFEREATSETYKSALSRFEAAYTQGARRPVVQNLLIPQLMLVRRVRAMFDGEPSPYPFQPVPSAALPAPARMIQARLLAERTLGRDAAVIVNLQRKGDESMRAADRRYTGPMTALMAERAHGPVHIASAETLPGGHDFDHIVIVYYPGTKYFAELLGSTFYQRIFSDKTLSDNQSTMTVPILDRL